MITNGVRARRGVISKSVPSTNKGSTHKDFILEGYAYSFKKHFKGVHIPEHAQFEVVIYSRNFG